MRRHRISPRMLLGILLWVWCTTTTTAIQWPRLPSKFNSNSSNKAATANKSNGQGTDFAEADTAAHLSHWQLEPLLQVPCSLQMVPNVDDPGAKAKKFAVTAICDTGAQRTCMTWQAAQRVGLAHLIDRRYAGQATGVGLCRVLGRIPAHTVLLQFYDSAISISAPAITILEDSDSHVDLLLGLDFLRDTQSVLNLKEECLQFTTTTTKGKTTATIRVPFIRPRSQVIVQRDHVDEEKSKSSSSRNLNKQKEEVTYCPSDQGRFVKEHNDKEEGNDESDDYTDLEEEEEDNTMDMSGL